MEKISSNIVYIVLIIVALIAAFFIGRNSGKKTDRSRECLNPTVKRTEKPASKTVQEPTVSKTTKSKRTPINRDFNNLDSLVEELNNSEN